MTLRAHIKLFQTFDFFYKVVGILSLWCCLVISVFPRHFSEMAHMSSNGRDVCNSDNRG